MKQPGFNGKSPAVFFFDRDLIVVIPPRLACMESSRIWRPPVGRTDILLFVEGVVGKPLIPVKVKPGQPVLSIGLVITPLISGVKITPVTHIQCHQCHL